MGVPDNSVIFHGAILSQKEIDGYKFPVGCKFRFTNASYNDEFTVVGIKKEPGSEYRQIIGRINGETWLLLGSLQREAASGTIKFIEPSIPGPPPVDANGAPIMPSEVQVPAKKTKKKVAKKASKKKSKGKK